MKQIIQSYKTGKMELVEVPIPGCDERGILVQTAVSLVSAGTEKMIIELAKKSLLGKAKARPDLVRQVLNKVKKEGLISTIKKVSTKLEVPIPLGYSCSGRVLISGREVDEVQPGDRVACAGAGYANHAEVNYIPHNLFVRIPDNVTDEEAAFTTVGTIALQGVRQLRPTLGEKIVVLGTGLIGLITVQLLKVNGCDVLAVDIDPKRLEIARKLGADECTDSRDLIPTSEEFSKGRGVDGVIITASSKSKAILADAGEVCRLKGRVVMVGFTPMEIPRDIYYKRELDLRMSMSYGPGRYDPNYEQNGNDYPFAYVRWTERRNMEAFLNLLKQNRLDLISLVTHRYEFTDVLKAYELIQGKKDESFLGVLLSYDSGKELKESVVNEPRKRKKESRINIGFIGAGNFAQSVTLPNLIKASVNLDTLLEHNGVNAALVAKKYRFRNLTSKAKDVFENPDINTIFITTPHASHGEYVLKGLQAGKHIFVEKPLTIDEETLLKIKQEFTRSNTVLMVGYNRRFSPHALEIRKMRKSIQTPLVMNYLVNAGPIPRDHWIQDPNVGGGRIVGEVCHFIDFMQYIAMSDPVAVFASSLATENQNNSNNDTVHICIDFKNGSIGNITYQSIGDSSLPKEYFEISGGGNTVQLYDFKKTVFSIKGRRKNIKSHGQQKGFKEEYEAFFESIISTNKPPIPFNSLYLTTLTTFRILESLQTGLKLDISS